MKTSAADKIFIFFARKRSVNTRAVNVGEKISNMGTPGYFYLRGVSFHIPLSAQGDARQDGLFCLLQLEKEFDTDSSTVAELKKNLNELQIEESCCGFDSVSDWGDEIPDSCECEPTLHDACQAKPQGSEGPDLVYKTTCGSIVSDMLNAYTIFRGLSFGLAVIALIGLLISLLMLHQVNRHDDVRNTITYY
ncbi:Tetraspanin-8 [Larimichthys crocea]|uniref:Uncharacterized protein n=1 Tax=Larimichthys crocea TaxID=215358 RepID=A0ACD3Q8B6_LARCR|nr:Tetraspanin-8 [Larimichthys crocea]